MRGRPRYRRCFCRRRRRGNVRRGGAHERIEHGVPDKAEHPDQPVGEGDREGRRVVAGGSAGDVSPDLAKQRLEARLREQAERASCEARPPVAARLALHQDELDVVLDDSVRLVRFPQESRRSAFDLVRRVRDLVPDDWSQIVEAQRAAAFLDGRVQRDNGMPPAVLAPRQADVADNTNEPASRNQRPVTHAPDGVELVEKLIVVLDPTQLRVCPAVFL